MRNAEALTYVEYDIAAVGINPDGLSRTPGQIVTFSGYSGAGKTTLMKQLNQYPEYMTVPKGTTRKLRSDSDPEYSVDEAYCYEAVRKGDFLYWMQYGGNWYFSSRTDMETISTDYPYALLDMPTRGALMLKDNLGDKVTTCFVTTPEPVRQSLSRRLIARGESFESIRRRLSDIETVGVVKDRFDIVITNTEPHIAAFTLINRLHQIDCARKVLHS